MMAKRRIIIAPSQKSFVLNRDKIILNSLEKTLNGGVPAIANSPIRKANPEIGNILRTPLTFAISLVLYLCKIFPDDRNNSDFVQEWLII